MQPERLNGLSSQVIGAAIEVHRQLGPGLDEKDYQLALVCELQSRDLSCLPRKGISIVYKGARLRNCFQVDLFVEFELLVELKSVRAIHPVHEAQLLTYLRLANKKLGLLINFNVPLLRQGIHRRVMGFGQDLQVADTRWELPNGRVSDSDLTGEVIAAAIEVYRHLGPGLLRSAYAKCLCRELDLRGLKYEYGKRLHAVSADRATRSCQNRSGRGKGIANHGLYRSRYSHYRARRSSNDQLAQTRRVATRSAIQFLR